MNGYDLSRIWFDWCFENPEKIKPNHAALYFFAIEHCNRLGWKSKFGLPTEMTKDAIGIKSYNTYINTLNDLVEWGFIKMIQVSKNQYSSNIIALSKNDKALDKALDKAIVKHVIKQSESTSESISSINKPLTINHITNNVEGEEEISAYSAEEEKLIISNYLESQDLFKLKKEPQKKENNQSFAESLKFESQQWLESVCIQQKKSPDKIIEKIDEFLKYLKTIEKEHPSRKEFISHFINWISAKFKDEAKKASSPKFSINQ